MQYVDDLYQFNVQLRLHQPDFQSSEVNSTLLGKVYDNLTVIYDIGKSNVLFHVRCTYDLLRFKIKTLSNIHVREKN